MKGGGNKEIKVRIIAVFVVIVIIIYVLFLAFAVLRMFLDKK